MVEERWEDFGRWLGVRVGEVVIREKKVESEIRSA